MARTLDFVKPPRTTSSISTGGGTPRWMLKKAKVKSERVIAADDADMAAMFGIEMDPPSPAQVPTNTAGAAAKKTAAKKTAAKKTAERKGAMVRRG